MKRKLISSVVGLALIMSMATTAMAAEAPKEKKEQVKQNGIYINRIAEDGKIITSDTLTESEFNELMKKMTNTEDFDISKRAKAVISGVKSIESLSAEIQSASIDNLKDILEKANFTASEKETILETQKNNESIFKQIHELYAKEGKLSKEELIKEVEKLEKEISPLFTQEQLKKLGELDLLIEGNIEISLDEGVEISDKDFEIVEVAILEQLTKDSGLEKSSGVIKLEPTSISATEKN